MVKIKMLKPLVPTADHRTVRRPASEGTRNGVYGSGERYRVWREQVRANAGRRCEWVEAGQRCTKAYPGHRMFADHVVELNDGGAAFDPANGQCLCGQHHSLKTGKARALRARS